MNHNSLSSEYGLFFYLYIVGINLKYKRKEMYFCLLNMASKYKGELLSVFESKGITDENVQTLY